MQLLSTPSHISFVLGLIKLESGREVTHLFLFDDEMMKDYADDAKILTDDNPILEFSTAKRALNQNPKEIIEDIKSFLGKNKR